MFNGRETSSLFFEPALTVSAAVTVGNGTDEHLEREPSEIALHEAEREHSGLSQRIEEVLARLLPKLSLLPTDQLPCLDRLNAP
jgi:hypothetical protein